MKRDDPYWFLDSLDWTAVESAYDARWKAHRALIEEAKGGASLAFARLALGMLDRAANYSAVEHGLGPKILASNSRATERIWQLAQQFAGLTRPAEVPMLIQKAGLSYCRVGVGSEMSSLMQPDLCWVCNTRTLWTWRVVEHHDAKHDVKWAVNRANEELDLYRDQDPRSEMYWPKWSKLHRDLENPMGKLIEASRAHKDPPKQAIYLWADAICNVSYETLTE